MKLAAAAVVASLAIVLLFVSVLKHPVYTPDGIVYARFAARDAGFSERDATLSARRFYERTAMMRNPRYRALVELDPSVSFARSKVFANRVLYPWIVAAALPFAGFRAMFLVNAAAYAAFGLALFWMLCAFRRPAVSAAIAILALVLPLTRSVAAADLTDMLAMVWWVLALGALLRCARTPSTALLAMVAVSSALLALTRPTPYLAVMPAIALGLATGRWRALVASLAGVAAYAAVAAETHAYGISEQLRWVYDHRVAATRTSFDAWYRTSLISSLRYVLIEAVRTVITLAMIAAIVYGLRRPQTRAQIAVLAGAALACLVAVPFNPVVSSLARVVALPLVPVFCAITQCALEALLDSGARVRQAAATYPKTAAVD